MPGSDSFCGWNLDLGTFITSKCEGTDQCWSGMYRRMHGINNQHQRACKIYSSVGLVSSILSSLYHWESIMRTSPFLMP